MKAIDTLIALQKAIDRITITDGVITMENYHSERLRVLLRDCYKAGCEQWQVEEIMRSIPNDFN